MNSLCILSMYVQKNTSLGLS